MALSVLALATLFVSWGANANETGTRIPILQGEPQEAYPSIEKIKATPRGYVIIGEGFGRNPEKVKVFENGSPVAEESIVGVSKTRISVFSIPRGKTGVSVAVRGQRTDAAYFTHVEPPAKDDPVETTASVRTVKSGALFGETSGIRSPAKKPAASAGATGGDGYLAREMLRLRDRLSMLEEEVSMLRQQLGITSR